jgi:polyisoprenoid-binding protein YceI
VRGRVRVAAHHAAYGERRAPAAAHYGWPMSRRLRIALLAVAAVVVLALVGGYAVLKLTGDDAPPPPTLSGAPAADGAAEGGAERWRPLARQGTFVGYRVNEEYLGVGVRTAVGRTSAVTGTVTVDGDRIEAADLTADMRRVVSDQSRRDDTLRYRGIETDRYPTARFTLASPFALAARADQTKGTLTLHGRRASIDVTVRGQRVAGGRLELVGSAPIEFGRFGIDPPSVAGIVSVRDHGVLEFRLVLGRG